MKQQDESPAAKADGRRRRWKRTLLLTTLFVCLFFVAVAERGGPAISKIRKDGIVATLLDPMSLFAGRSPGERGEGALLPTKLAKAGPEERVLSEVRDRDPGIGDPPAEPGFLPDAALPGSRAADAPPGGPAGEPFAPFGTPFGNPGDPGPSFIPGGPGGSPPFTPPPGGGIASGIPEPGTWAVMILGFFAVGWVMRRRAQLRPLPE
jgi:hypothetical protein